MSNPSSPRSPTSESGKISLRKELKEAKAAIAALQTEKLHLEDKVQKIMKVLEKERAQLRDVLSNAKLKIQKLEGENNSLKSQLSEALEEIERLKRLLRDMEARGSGESQVVVELRQSIQILLSGLTLLSSNYGSGSAQLSGDFRMKFNSFKSECNSIRDSNLSSCGQLAIEIASLFETILARADAADKRAAAAEKRLAEAQAALDEQRRQFMEEMQAERKSKPAVTEVQGSPRSPRGGEAALHKVIAELRDQLAIERSRSNQHPSTEQHAYSSQQWTRSLGSEETMDAALSLQGHTSMVNRCTVLSTGLIASCSDDKSIKIWRVEVGSEGNPTAECVNTLTGHAHWVNDVCVVSDDVIATASSDKNVKLWRYNPSTGEGGCIATLEGHESSVRSVCMIGDGLLALTSADKMVKIWRISTGRVVATGKCGQGLFGEVNVLVQSGNTSDPTVLASASDSDGVCTIRSYGL